MYKKPCCDNYVEAMRSVIARILVDKTYKYSETSVMDSKFRSFKNNTYTTTRVILDIGIIFEGGCKRSLN